VTADCLLFRGIGMENSRLRQLALLDLSILNFGLMRACRREDAPLRIDRSTIRDGFLLVRLISGANRRYQFQKRSQLFIRAHNEPLSVAAMRISNPDPSPVGFNR
jgi:hypothetical protein